ncbi:heat shock protein 70 family [Mycena latifolia]|nr:heat shock protein 70 family [Mycena latifolia]
MPLPQHSNWLAKAVSCAPFLLGLVFYGWRYTLPPLPVLEPIKWGENGAVVGIELGSVYSRASLLVAPGRVEVLKLDALGRRKIPSRVCFTGTDIVIGYTQADPACDGANVHEVRNLLDSTVGIMGSKNQQPSALRKKVPIVTAYVNGTLQTFNVTDIVAMVLQRLVSQAEAIHGQPITHAILAVPAYFTDVHRAILHDSARLANVTLLRILMEPTATAIAYRLDESDSTLDEQRVLVLDVGASVSAALLEIESGAFDTLARVHDRNAGGRALGERIARHAEATFIRVSGKGREGILGEAQMTVLRGRAEEAKLALSTQDKIMIDVPTNDGTIFPVRLTRSEFVAISRLPFEDVMQCVEEVLLEANVTASEVDQIILAGGSAFIPRLSELLLERFPGRQPLTSPNVQPDEAVVFGVALHARHFADHDDFICCVDTTPLAFGIEVSNGDFAVVLPRHSIIPNSKSRSFNLADAEIRVYVGHGNYTNGTYFLGSLTLPKPFGGEVEVRFDVDQDGSLTVFATNSAGQSTSTIIHPSEESGAATTRMLAELEAAANRDAARAQIQYASHIRFTAHRAELEQYLGSLPFDHVLRQSGDMLVSVIDEADAWITDNLYSANVDALREKIMTTEQLIRLGMVAFQLGISHDDGRTEL